MAHLADTNILLRFLQRSDPVPETDRRAGVIERVMSLLPDRREVHAEWRRLVVRYAVSGVQVHDARLVTTMRLYGLTDILTLNTGDFRRYPGIVAIHPRDI